MNDSERACSYGMGSASLQATGKDEADPAVDHVPDGAANALPMENAGPMSAPSAK